MAEHLIIVEHDSDWRDTYPAMNVVSAREYLIEPQRFRNRGMRILNLCRSYRYLSEGYYCSLLGEARRHKIIPAVRTLTDLSRKSVYSLNFDNLEQRLLRLSRAQTSEPITETLEMLICFGRCENVQWLDFARQIYEMFPCPLMKVVFRHKGHWQIQQVKAISLNALRDEQHALFIDGLEHFLSRRWRSSKKKNRARYDLAILHNPGEQLPPSNPAALRKFIQAGGQLGLEVELVQQKDYNRLGEYDALFIRETTAIEHHTYRFATRAEAEGIVVMDDPDSIVRCTNKVYLTELLRANRVALPGTMILRKGEDLNNLSVLGYPVVLKIPNGSFSRGIYKAGDFSEVQRYCRVLFKESDLILAQEFMYTDFDWRIGVLNRQPLFACQYFMSKAHWQIVSHDAKGGLREGDYKAWALEQVPSEVINIAVRAANLIGDGFYGVDLKQTAKGVVVMEVNDNPNVESGVEDGVLGMELYRAIIGEFLRRLERRTMSHGDVAA